MLEIWTEVFETILEFFFKRSANEKRKLLILECTLFRIKIVNEFQSNQLLSFKMLQIPLSKECFKKGSREEIIMKRMNSKDNGFEKS